MRTCLRCETEMIQDFDLKVEGGACGIKVTEQGIFKDSLGRLKCAVCPNCGYSEIYLDDTTKVKSLNQ